MGWERVQARKVVNVVMSEVIRKALRHRRFNGNCACVAIGQVELGSLVGQAVVAGVAGAGKANV